MNMNYDLIDFVEIEKEEYHKLTSKQKKELKQKKLIKLVPCVINNSYFGWFYYKHKDLII